MGSAECGRTFWPNIPATWVHLGPKMAHLAAKLGSNSVKLGPKISSWRVLEPKSPQEPPKTLPSPKTGGKSNPPRGPFWKAFGAMLTSKSHLKATQKAYKILIDFDIHFSSILHRFWKRFGKVLGAMLASKMHYTLSSNFERFFDRFFIDFSLKLNPSKP